MRITILAVVFVGFLVAHSENAPAQNVASPTAPAEPGAGAGLIAGLQRQLKEEGYNPGVVNGVMSEQTRQALSRYVARHGGAPAAAAADPVKQAQAGLQQLGLFAGPADGVVGPQTRDAILRFQAQHHLAIDPRVSDTLLAALAEAGAGVPAAAAAASPPPSAAQAAVPATPGRRPLPSWVNPPTIR